MFTKILHVDKNHTGRHIHDIRSTLTNILHEDPYEMPRRGIAETVGEIIASEGIEKAVKE